MRQSSFRRLLGVLLLTSGLSVATAAAMAAPPSNDFRRWAPTPPLGWNSWDAFGTTVTETQIKQQADFMAAKLKSRGWQHITVDIHWYQPTAKGHSYEER